MRVSPVIWKAKDEHELLFMATKSAIATHNHPEGIKGAQAIAMAGYMALNGSSKKEIQEYAQKVFGYDIEGQAPNRKTFEVSCQDTVPKAIKAFIDADDFSQSIRGAMRMGRDTDTLACMTGAISEPYFYGRKGLPTDMKKSIFTALDKTLGDTVVRFMKEFVSSDFDPECEIKD
jgi:ADP-ribosylglycohydrolase